MIQNRYSFREDFKAFDGKGVPPGLLPEINSVYTHDHVRVDKGVFYITCAGAKFMCRTPDLKDLRADLSVRFHHCEGRRGFCVIFVYDMDRRKGFALDFSFGDGKADVLLRRVDRSDRETLSRADYACDMPRGDILVCIAVSQGAVSGEICGIGFAFDLPEGYVGGKAGVELTSSVGELAVNRIAVESGDEMTVEVIAEEKTAELSLLCGGTMPYTLSYSLKRINGVPYLDYRFDGGEQYRDRYPGHPRHTGQYSVECHKFTDPYIALYDPASMKRICGIPLYSGTFMTA
ncbi:MAG: hypothetical protein K6D94_03030, partial [Clostridiales bacterium]|nr:hypothetical protein [Clostridiales bacterium]